MTLDLWKNKLHISSMLNLLLHVWSQLNCDVLVVLAAMCNQLRAAQTAELRSCNTGSQGLTCKRGLLDKETHRQEVSTDRLLTWHGYHGSSSPEDVHARRVTVAQRRVEAHVSELASPHMLLLRSHRGENDTGGGETKVLSVLLNVGLPDSREAEEPQHTVGHSFQDLHADE